MEILQVEVSWGMNLRFKQQGSGAMVADSVGVACGTGVPLTAGGTSEQPKKHRLLWQHGATRLGAASRPRWSTRCALRQAALTVRTCVDSSSLFAATRFADWISDSASASNVTPSFRNRPAPEIGFSAS